MFSEAYVILFTISLTATQSLVILVTGMHPTGNAFLLVTCIDQLEYLSAVQYASS